jgi:MFS family permease
VQSTDAISPPLAAAATGHPSPAADPAPLTGVPAADPTVGVTGASDLRSTPLMLGLLFGLTGTGSSAAAVVLPEMRIALGLTVPGAAWALSVYALALAVTTAVYGRVADVVGIRKPLIAGVLLMSAGAALAAAAPSLPLLLVGRLIQGAGAGAVPVLATALISARYAGVARGAALGRMAGASAAISALGPLLGGAVETTVGWRVVLVMPVLGLLFLPFAAKAAPARGAGGRLDVRGAVLVAATASGLVLLLQSVSAGLVVAGAGAALLMAGTPMLVRHVRRRPEGFLPLAVVTRGPMVRAALAGATVPAAWFALLLAVPAALHARGWSTLETGAALVPSAVIGLLAAQVAGRVMQRFGAQAVLVGAAVLSAVSLGVAAPAVREGWPVVLAAAVAGVTIAFSVGQPAMIYAVSGAVPTEVRGVALGVATLTFMVGGSLGAAAVGGLADAIGLPSAVGAVAVLPVVAATLVLLTGRARSPRGGE